MLSELKGVIEAIQKIGVETPQEQPDMSSSDPFGLEAAGGEMVPGFGFPPQMPPGMQAPPPPPPSAVTTGSNVKQVPCPPLSSSAPLAPMTPLTPLPVVHTPQMPLVMEKRFLVCLWDTHQSKSARRE